MLTVRFSSLFYFSIYYELISVYSVFLSHRPFFVLFTLLIVNVCTIYNYVDIIISEIYNYQICVFYFSNSLTCFLFYRVDI